MGATASLPAGGADMVRRQWAAAPVRGPPGDITTGHKPALALSWSSSWSTHRRALNRTNPVQVCIAAAYRFHLAERIDNNPTVLAAEIA